MGVPLTTAVEAIQGVQPFTRRMKPVSGPNGITFIQDDQKAPLWAISHALQFMKHARAERKIVVIGTISDYAGNADRVYVSVARQALEVADRVVFVGTRASKCLKARRHPQDEALQAFYTVEAACEHFAGSWQPGDLVLLKGSAEDGLGRIIKASKQSGPAVAQGSMELQSTSPKLSSQAIVGLGNPGRQYEDTPHNIGHRVLDLLARSFGVQWAREDEAMVALIEHRGQNVFLIKPLTMVNSTGPTLLQLGRRMGFGPAECVLVHDDLDLLLGGVRLRTAGSDGGHRGVRSVLESFRTDALRRVKIGVGRPEQKDNVVGYVLTAFSPAEIPLIDKACAEAADQVLKLLEVPRRIGTLACYMTQIAFLQAFDLFLVQGTLF